MSDDEAVVVNVNDVKEEVYLDGDHWGHAFKVLTPSMRGKGGKLGVNQTRLPPGRAAGPFHHHRLEDEVFFIQSGTGWLRYGDELTPLKAGDCVSCPAATGVAHQIANTGDVDLVYLAIGNHDPEEVCAYPDTGKVMVRAFQQVGYLEKVPYMDGEPEKPKILDLVERAK